MDDEIKEDPTLEHGCDTCQNENELDVKKLEKELQEHKEKYLRTLAEMENTRKRMQKERQEMTKFAVDQVVADFILPLDQFEKALEFASSMSEDVKTWAMGFKMILSQMQDVMTSHGVRAFSCIGEVFNPHEHEAVETEETTSVQEGIIIAEFSKGYKSADRVIKPAKVKVAIRPKTETPAQQES